MHFLQDFIRLYIECFLIYTVLKLIKHREFRFEYIELLVFLVCFIPYFIGFKILQIIEN